MGITDIDDKIIARAASNGRADVQTAGVVARRFEHEFFRDMAMLGVLPPDAVTRVTEFLPDIIRFVQVLCTTSPKPSGDRSRRAIRRTRMFTQFVSFSMPLDHFASDEGPLF